MQKYPQISDYILVQRVKWLPTSTCLVILSKNFFASKTKYSTLKVWLHPQLHFWGTLQFICRLDFLENSVITGSFIAFLSSSESKWTGEWSLMEWAKDVLVEIDTNQFVNLESIYNFTAGARCTKNLLFMYKWARFDWRQFALGSTLILVAESKTGFLTILEDINK